MEFTAERSHGPHSRSYQFDDRGHQAHAIPHGKRRPRHSVLQGEDQSPFPGLRNPLTRSIRFGSRANWWASYHIRRPINLTKAGYRQAMKALRQELTADGRLDILERVMSYRGGYSQEVGLPLAEIERYLTIPAALGSPQNRTRSLLRQLTWNRSYQCAGTGRRHRRLGRGDHVGLPYGRLS